MLWYHRIVEAGSSGGHLVQSPAQVGSPVAGCLGLCPGRFLISQRSGNSTDALDNFWQCNSHPHSETVSWSSCNTSFQFVPFASCPIIRYHWQELGFVLFTSSLHVFIYINNIPLEPSPGWAVLLSQAFLVGETLQSLYYTSDL